MVGLINNWVSHAQLSVNEAEWLADKRATAIQQLKQLDDPGRKLESWRYAESSRLYQSIETVDSPQSLTDCIDEAASDVKIDECVIRLQDDGFVVSDECPDYLDVQAINSMSENEWLDLAFGQETVVNLANTALFNSGVFVCIKTNAKNPIKIVIEYDYKNNNQWQFIRNHLKVTADTSITLEERWLSGRINAVNVYQLEDQVSLLRHQKMSLSQTAQFVSFNYFEVANDVNIVTMNQHYGGGLQHHIHQFNLRAHGAKVKLGSINKSYANNNISDIVQVNHYSKNNQSDVTHRSIAKDQSQIYNNAKAVVAPGADQSVIEQDLKNILLSENAKIFSKPELEVYADEVVAAHGSTIGALDETALFYLQSRGIDVEQAREIMIESFEQEAVVC